MPYSVQEKLDLPLCGAEWLGLASYPHNGLSPPQRYSKRSTWTTSTSSLPTYGAEATDTCMRQCLKRLEHRTALRHQNLLILDMQAPAHAVTHFTGCICTYNNPTKPAYSNTTFSAQVSQAFGICHELPLPHHAMIAIIVVGIASCLYPQFLYFKHPTKTWYS